MKYTLKYYLQFQVSSEYVEYSASDYEVYMSILFTVYNVQSL